MKTKQAIVHFGSRAALADALGVRPQAIGAWGEYPPDEKQAELQGITDGKLMAEGTVHTKYREIAKWLGML